MTLLVDTIGKLLLKQVNLSGDNKAIGWIENQEVKSLSFNDYLSQISAISLGLIEKGLKVGDKVSILSSTCKEWNMIDLAVMCSRAVVVPIYPSYHADEVEYIVEHSESQILIVENDLQLDKILHFKNRPQFKLIISFHELSDESQKKIRNNFEYISFKEISTLGLEKMREHPDHFENIIKDQVAHEVATIIYTSGTTGKPKGAVITHDGITSMIYNVKKFTQGGFSYQDRTLTFLPLSHVLGRCDSLLNLVFGWQNIYAESLDKVLDNLKIAKPTVMIAVPRIFEKIYNHIQFKLKNENFIAQQVFKWALKSSENYYEKINKDLSPSPFELAQYQLAYHLVFKKINDLFGGNIRYFVTGGAPLSKNIISFLTYSGLTILEGYGLTETIAPCVLNPLSKQIIGSVGQPIGDVKISFTSENEIIIKSKAMFTEYYKDPELTQTTMENGWLKTGDIGYFNDDGFLFITDRKKDIIVTSGGKNIAPQKIENLAKSLPLISHLVVVGDGKKHLVALVGLEADRIKARLNELKIDQALITLPWSQSEELIRLVEQDIEKLNSQLAPFETIKKFHILDMELTIDNYLTPSLKVKRKNITQDYKSTIDAMYSK